MLAGKTGPKHSKPERIEAARERAEGNLAAAYRGLARKAVDRLDDALEPGAEPQPVQSRVACWTLDKAVPSVDAREATCACDHRGTAMWTKTAGIGSRSSSLEPAIDHAARSDAASPVGAQ